MCEYGKSGKDAAWNRDWLFSAATHLFNQDPVRCALYGLTIEDCNFSLWYFCRSHTAKSRAFNFMENPTTLVKVFISFMFAHSGLLGFDTNIHRVMYSPMDGCPSISYDYRLPINDNGPGRAHYY
ncbi:hypothetical protein FA13DRAFT_1797438 [Coprinellus micaceus]|uniref:Fungal-type protein kinase domain-containing protein n=1 Tax=Coprinellus micaceus TaxID=71717 RepID=A0A4Y7SR70_COPMI|nr:hypothetical protein FA13DRAFT_1797438 [Coprinellus micaceus]